MMKYAIMHVAHSPDIRNPSNGTIVYSLKDTVHANEAYNLRRLNDEVCNHACSPFSRYHRVWEGETRCNESIA